MTSSGVWKGVADKHARVPGVVAQQEWGTAWMVVDKCLLGKEVSVLIVDACLLRRTGGTTATLVAVLVLG